MARAHQHLAQKPEAAEAASQTGRSQVRNRDDERRQGQDRRVGRLDRRFVRSERRSGQDRRPRSTRGEHEPLYEARSEPAVLRRDAAYKRALAATDFAAVLFGLLSVVGLASDASLTPGALLIAAGVIPFSIALRLYDDDEHRLRKETLEEVPRLLQVTGIAVAATALAQGLAFEGNFGRLRACLLFAVVFVALATLRAATRRILEVRLPPERCLVVGDAPTADRLRDKLAAGPRVNAEVVGRVPSTPDDTEQGSTPVVGSLELLGLILVERDIHRVVVAPPNVLAGEDTLETIRLVKAMGVKVSILPRLFEVVGSSVRFDDVDGITLLGVRHYGLSRSARLTKRVFDILVSVSLIAVLAPLWLWLAIAIKLDSRGPVHFRQRRIGEDSREFEIIKFRTMELDAEAKKADLLSQNETEGVFKMTKDPRMTRMGSWLRRLSLDEVPQLLNVLRGDMSLVGPRPLVPDEDRKIGGFERRRLELPPGMTGAWQVLGSARIPMPEMVKIDYLYGANWSLWLDLRILIRTAVYVAARRNL